MQNVTPKKWLGQHFLKDLRVAERIAETITEDVERVLEVGAGMGVLTQFLLKNERIQLKAIEIDTESVEYLAEHFPELEVLEEDFLKIDLRGLFGGSEFGIIGNFPYNISTEILFRVIENRDSVPFFSGMFQKEVAERICAKSGSKVYGITSVMAQAYYDTEYLFTVPESVFVPPPKVKSGVIRLRRKKYYQLDCDEKLFQQVVRTAFGQRRKTMRNSLKAFGVELSEEIFSLRPEQIDYNQFIQITNLIFNKKTLKDS